MPNPTSNKVLHPTNPTLVKDVNIPREKGQTRVLPDGSLLYREPKTGEEVPAVRLEDIRPPHVQEASKKLSYRFPKKRGYEDTNVTAFVKKDYNYGPKRENRSDRLFQIQSDGAKGEKPDGYVMDRGRIVLEAFDHGLRNFGNQLPMYVSSELKGHEIEDYLRRNREISVYDLVARAPNGYYKGQRETKNKKAQKDDRAREWHVGPPRVGTFSMRATRFRLATGCLCWEKKDGTAAKNQRILDVIPAQYKDAAVNSTKGWRDLNKAEIKRIKDGAMRKPQQGQKAKRAAQAKILEKIDCPVEDFAESGGLLKDKEEIEYQVEDAWTGAPKKQDNCLWPGLDPRGFGSSMQASTPKADQQSRKIWQTPTVEGETFANPGNELPTLDSAPSRKRSRGHSDTLSGEGSNRAQKRARTTIDAQNHGTEGGYTRIRTSRMGRPPQQRRPAPEPLYIARDTSPASTHAAIGSSTPVLQGNVDQLYNSHNTVNEVSAMPNAHNSNRPSTYVSPVYELQQTLPLKRGFTDFSAPLPQPTTRDRPQQHPPPSKASLKRKQAPSTSTTPHPNEPHPHKRLKAHCTTQPAAALQFQTSNHSAPDAKSHAHHVPSTPCHGQLNSTHPLFSPPPGIINRPEFSQHLPPFALQEEEEPSWNGERFPPVAEGEEEEEEDDEGYTPPPILNNQQEETCNHPETGAAEIDAYFPTSDSSQINQDAHGGPEVGGGRRGAWVQSPACRLGGMVGDGIEWRMVGGVGCRLARIEMARRA